MTNPTSPPRTFVPTIYHAADGSTTWHSIVRVAAAGNRTLSMPWDWRLRMRKATGKNDVQFNELLSDIARPLLATPDANPTGKSFSAWMRAEVEAFAQGVGSLAGRNDKGAQ